MIKVIDLQNDTNIEEEIKDALVTTGVFYLKNHGVSTELIRDLELEAKKFYNLPLSEKRKLRLIDQKNILLGWVGIEEEVTAGKGDGRECIYCTADHERQKGNRIYEGPTPWRMEDSKLKALTTEYIMKMESVAKLLLQYMSTALQLEKNYFTKRFCAMPLSSMAIGMYPPYDKHENDTAWGVGPHTDGGFLAILHQDNSGGLEIFNLKRNQWVEVPPKDDCLVVNIGDMMECWTHRIFTATAHRVRHKKRSDMRISLPFFIDPNWSADFSIFRKKLLISANSKNE